MHKVLIAILALTLCYTEMTARRGSFIETHPVYF
jgi:hypothetical protein